MLVPRRLAQRQYRRHAGVGPVENLRPVISRMAKECRRKHLRVCRPALVSILIRGVDIADVHHAKQRAKKPVLDCANCDVLTVPGFVAARERCRAIEQVALPTVSPETACEQTVKHRHHRRAAVHHRGVDDLALAGACCLEHGRQQTHREIQRAAAKITHQVERQRRRPVRVTDTAERAAQRDVVGIVAGGVCQRAILSPARHAPVDQPFVSRHAGFGTQPELLHDAGPEAFENGVGDIAQSQDQVDAGLALEIHEQAGTTPVHQVVLLRNLGRRFPVGWPLDPDDVRTHVGQQHAA